MYLGMDICVSMQEIHINITTITTSPKKNDTPQCHIYGNGANFKQVD